MHDIHTATQKIHLWKDHILRTVHQDFAKNTILEKLKPNQVLIIIDWAMKFLPVSYRETQSEWFGKKGHPWHVCAVIMKTIDGEYEVSIFFCFIYHFSCSHAYLHPSPTHPSTHSLRLCSFNRLFVYSLKQYIYFDSLFIITVFWLIYTH